MTKKPMAGAGTKKTRLFESLQCYACAARKKKGKPLVDIDDLIKQKNNNATAPVTLDTAVKGLDDGWYQSCITTANQMFVDFPDLSKYDYSFVHPDGALGGQISTEFNKLKGKSGLKNINKWNPADIWVVKSTFNFKGGFKTLDDYNEYILTNFKKRNLLGVSLKKLGKNSPATMSEYNMGATRNAKFTGYKVGDEITSAKDASILFTVNRSAGNLSMRTFPRDWCGELLGKNARAGKVAPSVLFDAARDYGVPESSIDTPISVKVFLKKPSKQQFEKFIKMWKTLSGSRQQVKDILPNVMKKHKEDPGWFFSKYLGVSYCYAVSKSGAENEIINSIYHYASSQSDSSSAFIKYD
jgi:hypothetical protein